MPHEAKRQQINVYLLKSSISDYDDALSRPDDWETEFHDLDFGSGTKSRLFARIKSRHEQAKWMTFLKEALVNQTPDPFADNRISSAAALVLLQIDGRTIHRVSTTYGLTLDANPRWFALCYGHGRSFLANVWEPRFGFRIALNVANQVGFQQVDFEQYANQSIQRTVTSSRLSSLGILGYDNEQDMIRRIVAKLEKSKTQFGYRISGRDNVSLSCDLKASDLRNKCIELLVQFTKEDYKARFPDAEAIAEVKSPGEIQQLNYAVEQELSQNQLEDTHFACPDPILYDEHFGGFDFTDHASGSPVAEITWDMIRQRLPNSSQVTQKDLKGIRVQAMRSEGGFLSGPWPVWNFVVSQKTLPTGFYGLLGGEWYQFQNEYIRDLNAYIDAIQHSSVVALRRGAFDSEDAYLQNLKPMQSLPFVVAHKICINYGGGQSKAELCDLLRVSSGPNDPHVLVHIKGSGSGAEFGHLVNQAALSIELLTDESSNFGDESLRSLRRQARINNVTLPSHFERQGSKYHVVLAVFQSSSRPASQYLTLFSKVTLRRTVKILRKYGCRITLERMLPQCFSNIGEFQGRVDQ